MVKKLKIVVLLGGGSEEREVSIKSGWAVISALNEIGMQAIPMDPSVQSIWNLTKKDCDVVFIALHGGDGENGRVQAALDIMGIPYTGSGVQASAIAMDKWLTKLVWRDQGLPTPVGEVVSNGSKFEEIETRLGLPLFFKPTREGSSIGIVKVSNAGGLRIAFEQRLDSGMPFMAEEAILGGEYTAAIVGDNVLPLVKIIPTGDFYDYDAKYIRNDTQYLCPCGLSADREAEIQRAALVAFKAIGCTGWGRVDLLLDSNENHYFLEINTSPGMTDHSLVPKAASVAGMSFGDLVLSICMTANIRR